MALSVIPQLLWALVPGARDARPSCVKGQPPPPLSQGCKSKRPCLKCQGGPRETERPSAISPSKLYCTQAISLQNLPSVIFIYPKVEKTPCRPLVHPTRELNTP